MARYIDCDKAVSYFENHRRIGLHKDDIVAYLSSLPTADVEEVKHGEWIYKHRHRGGFEKKAVYDVFVNPHTVSIYNRYECDEPYCSVCGKLGDDFLNYCGNCGAKMDGGKEE